MSLTLIGKKRGMTRVFDEQTRKSIPCTVIEIQANQVLDVRTVEKHGYMGVQLGSIRADSTDKKRMRKPDLGQFEKRKLDPQLKIAESRVNDSGEYEVGKEFGPDYFAEGELVDVRGRSKGKGYQGVIKRFGVGRIVSSHGAGPVVRHLGSFGSVRGHGRVFKGKKGAGHMGDENVIVEKLKVIKVDTKLNALVVKGAIPGANGGVVYIRKAVKTTAVS